VLPVFLELRRIEAGETVKTHILNFFSGVGVDLDDQVLESFLESGRVILFLDAFDELDENLVLTILKEIEALAARFEALRIVVTSRPASALRMSRHFRVVELSDLQKKEFEFVVRKLRSAAPARNGFIQVEACGGGILLIERDCIAALLKRAPQLSDGTGKGRTPLTRDLPRLIRAFDPLVRDDGARLSEDFAFCHRWRTLCAGEVWANTTHPITHVGLHHFAARYADSEPVAPTVVISPKTGKVLTGRIAAGNGKTPAAKPAKATAGKTVTVRFGDRQRPTRH